MWAILSNGLRSRLNQDLPNKLYCCFDESGPGPQSDVSMWGIDPPHGRVGVACMTSPMESHHPGEGGRGCRLVSQDTHRWPQ